MSTDDSAPSPGIPGDDAAPHPPQAAFPRWLLLAGAVVLVLASVAATLGVQYWRTPGESSAEAGFARDMSAHHGRAVSMALTAYRSTTDPEMAHLAMHIVTAEQAQLGTMQAWLEEWGLSPNSDEPPLAWADHRPPDQGLPGMATTEQLAALRAARGQAADVLFCQLMYRHDEGALVLIDAVLPATSDRHVLELARSMKTGLQDELTELRAYLTERAAPLPR